MSRTETHFGKLRKISLKDKTIEEFFQVKCNEKSIDNIDKYYDTWKETYFDNVSYEKFIVIKDDIWEVFEHVECNEDDVDIITTNEDGTLSFIMQFYNGGTCLTEMLEEGLAEYLKCDKK